MAEKYQDAMALCRCYGNPDLFITMTANPKWAKIDEYLRISGDSSANDRPDIESQAGRENVCSNEIDKFVSAELPDRIIDPEETNKIDPDARKLTYVQFLTKYVWNKTEHTWTKRKIGQSIGRLYNVHPSSGELYYLRLLINHLKGPTSFEDILTVNGVEYKKFHESCVARGLLDGDEEWHEAMTEAATWATPQQLRELFVMLLVHCEVLSPLKLWNAFWKYMSEDIVYQQRRLLNFTDYDLSDVELQTYTLIEVELLLFQYDQSLSNYTDLPKLDKSSIGRLSNTVLADEQYLHVQCLKDSSKEQISLLNEEQKKVYEAVLDSVHNNSGKLFFLYGPGGTGKTFVYNTIINKLRSEKIVIPVASSGIAALLLPGGRTAHSRFKIPLNLFDDSVCDITCGTMLADLLIQAKLIIWDEAPMTHKYAFEALDRSLRDIMSKTDKDAHLKPFGGKTVLLGGDFRQTLPIISQGTRQDCVAASINRSYLREFVQMFVLSQNMRIHKTEVEFAKWILFVGDGTATKDNSKGINYSYEDHIYVDDSLMLITDKEHISALAKHVYTSFQENYTNIDYLRDRAILSPRNDTVDVINSEILK
uniref:ATP-dependent DNA helicase n=1 Tax=Brassica oleracea var. oleracea TaxID=109376 RepID=A0A0D3D610_BRAOL